MLGPELELNLTIPEQSLTSLSFADHSAAGIEDWTSNLPMANVGETARQLYQGIIEVNKLAMPPATRSQILETLRDPIHFISSELSKHFLNQAIALPEKQQKIANLVQALHIHLATGYKIVMMESLASITNEKVRKNFACASHRMTSEYGNVLVRSSQLYSNSPKGIWVELHQVYRFSEGIGLLKYTISDKQNKHLEDTRIDQAYKRNLLLSCGKPNQLRQHEIDAAYGAYELWADHVEVGEAFSANSVFVINMEQDAPPKYKSLLHEELNDKYYGFDTAELVQRLTDQLSAKHQKSSDGVVHLKVPKGVSDSMLNHISHALGILTKRTFKRIANNGSLHLCVGLSASHYYTSGKKSFQNILLQSNAAIMSSENQYVAKSRQSEDAWSDAHDAAGGGHMATPAGVPLEFERPEQASNKPEFPQYVVPLINTSPGGYCLQWNDSIPGNVQAGEVLAVRESSNQPWSIAVIRWIRHARKQGTQLGIELLAPHAQPCAVQLLHRTGAPSEYLRGLLLPELSSISQPSTLITPRVPFQSGHKVSIRFSDSESKCILESAVASTASFNQFKLSPAVALNNLTTNLTGDNGDEDDFDSLWPSL
ncbi:MAG: GTPase [Oleiphilus sp.]|nr:MAG: GTPase [Oleiphilus sp.]